MENFLYCIVKMLPSPSLFPTLFILLPHQFVAVGVEDEGSRPAAFAADFGDLILAAESLQPHAEKAVVHEIVPFGCLIDELLVLQRLQCQLDAAWSRKPIAENEVE